MHALLGGGREEPQPHQAGELRCTNARLLRLLPARIISDDRLTVTLNVYTGNGLSIAQIEEHWLGVTGLERSSLRKHQLNHYPTSSSGTKRNRLPYGVCTLGVKASTREVQHIYGAIQEYAGFEERAWLDGRYR